jgi:beta-barrel assembly-enhancing protease
MRQEAPALIFGPNLLSGGVRGSVAVTAQGIEIVFGDHSQSARFAELTLREVGFGKPGVELAWQESDGAWAVHVLDPQDAQRLLRHSPLQKTQQVNALLKQGRRNKVGRSVGRTVFALIVLSPLLLLALLWMFSDPIAGWITKRIPIEQEVQMGRQAFEGMKGQLKLHDQGPQFDAVKSIVMRLTQNSLYSYEVHVTDDPTLNAFAMPGGIVVVNSGLIAATKRPEELAGVLAHEVQHVELRHSLRSMIKNLGLQSVWAMTTGDLNSTLTSQITLQLATLKFSRDAESEADNKGFDALLAAKIDPSGMPAFFATMTKQVNDASAAFLSTHPLSVDRERALQQRLSVIKEPFTALDLGAWPPRALN